MFQYYVFWNGAEKTNWSALHRMLQPMHESWTRVVGIPDGPTFHCRFRQARSHSRHPTERTSLKSSNCTLEYLALPLFTKWSPTTTKSGDRSVRRRQQPSRAMKDSAPHCAPHCVQRRQRSTLCSVQGLPYFKRTSSPLVATFRRQARTARTTGDMFSSSSSKPPARTIGDCKFLPGSRIRSGP